MQEKSAFYSARDVEAKSVAMLLPYIKELSSGRFVQTHQGKTARDIQKRYGDIAINMRDTPETLRWIELKAEEEELTGNLYLETWSNKCRETKGWFYTLEADYLFYHFINTNNLYVCNFSTLKAWGIQNLEKYSEKRQSKRDQLNDTWGRCVPIKILEKEAGLKRPQSWLDYRNREYVANFVQGF